MNGFIISIKTNNSKTAQMLGSGGYLTRRRVHAIHYETLEKAQEQLNFLTSGEQPEWFVSATVKAVRS